MSRASVGLSCFGLVRGFAGVVLVERRGESVGLPSQGEDLLALCKFLDGVGCLVLLMTLSDQNHANSD